MDQLTYTETRCECLRDLGNPLEIPCGALIHDKMRFCKGDGPAVEFECGQQRGGHFSCAGCAVHANRVYELDHASRCKVTTYLERQHSVLGGPIGRKLSMAMHPKPFANMSKSDLEKEVAARGLATNGELKPDLQRTLTSHLRGKIRVPALLFLNSDVPIPSLHLEDYEVLPCEPMHDILRICYRSSPTMYPKKQHHSCKKL